MVKKTMFVTALSVVPVGSNAMARESSGSLMAIESEEFLSNGFCALVVERAFRCVVDLVVTTANVLPKRLCGDMWRDARVTE